MIPGWDRSRRVTAGSQFPREVIRDGSGGHCLDRRNVGLTASLTDRYGIGDMEWAIRELAADETHALRRAVSADGRMDLPSMHHELDDTDGAWHLGAVDAAGRIVAISSFYLTPYPRRPEAQPSVELAFMAVDPALQRRGIGSAVMAEAIRRLKESDAALPHFLLSN
jgi:ribosomal protein S18 acetylase RimI-like enzyme